MAGKLRNGSFIFGNNSSSLSRKTFLGCSVGSLLFHVFILIFLGSGLWFAESHKIEFESVQAKLVKLGEERDKKLLPRITKPKPAPKSEKKDPKPEPKKEEKPVEKPKPKPDGKANSLKPKEEPKPAEKTKPKEEPKEEQKKPSSLDDLLSGDVMEKIKRDARAEETKEGAKDGVDDGDVTVADTSVYHTVAFNLTVERSFWMLNQVSVEVKAVAEIIFGWTWESGPYSWRKL